MLAGSVHRCLLVADSIAEFCLFWNFQTQEVLIPESPSLLQTAAISVPHSDCWHDPLQVGQSFDPSENYYTRFHEPMLCLASRSTPANSVRTAVSSGIESTCLAHAIKVKIHQQIVTASVLGCRRSSTTLSSFWSFSLRHNSHLE